MKKILFLAILSTILIAFSSCSEKSEEVIHKVKPYLVYGDYSGTYTNVSGNIGSLVTTTDNYYKVTILDHGGGNTISVKGSDDSDINLTIITLSTYDGITYTGSSDDPHFRYFSFNVGSENVELKLYHNDEQKEFEGRKL